jgi:hypothetical protein
MPCFAQRRNTAVDRPRAMAEIASMGGMHSIGRTDEPVLPLPLDACRDEITLIPETSGTARRHPRFGGTTPIPGVTAIGRPQARNKEGSCGNEQY